VQTLPYQLKSFFSCIYAVSVFHFYTFFVLLKRTYSTAYPSFRVCIRTFPSVIARQLHPRFSSVIADSQTKIHPNKSLSIACLCNKIAAVFILIFRKYSYSCTTLHLSKLCIATMREQKAVFSYIFRFASDRR